MCLPVSWTWYNKLHPSIIKAKYSKSNLCEHLLWSKCPCPGHTCNFSLFPSNLKGLLGLHVMLHLIMLCLMMLRVKMLHLMMLRLMMMQLVMLCNIMLRLVVLRLMMLHWWSCVLSCCVWLCCVDDVAFFSTEMRQLDDYIKPYEELSYSTQNLHKKHMRAKRSTGSKSLDLKFKAHSR